MDKNPLTVFDRFYNEFAGDLAKTTVGMNRVFDGLRNSLNAYDSYPPFNFEQVDDNHYRITFALAGFTKNDISLTFKKEWLVIEGKKTEEEASDDRKRVFLHRGIATRSFTRSFQLAPNIVVTSAAMENGLLNIDLEHVLPEEEKEKVIKIK